MVRMTLYVHSLGRFPLTPYRMPACRWEHHQEHHWWRVRTVRIGRHRAHLTIDTTLAQTHTTPHLAAPHHEKMYKVPKGESAFALASPARALHRQRTHKCQQQTGGRKTKTTPQDHAARPHAYLQMRGVHGARPKPRIHATVLQAGAIGGGRRGRSNLLGGLREHCAERVRLCSPRRQFPRGAAYRSCRMLRAAPQFELAAARVADRPHLHVRHARELLLEAAGAAHRVGLPPLAQEEHPDAEEHEAQGAADRDDTPCGQRPRAEKGPREGVGCLLSGHDLIGQGQSGGSRRRRRQRRGGRLRRPLPSPRGWRRRRRGRPWRRRWRVDEERGKERG